MIEKLLDTLKIFLENGSGNLNFFTQVCEIGGVPNFGDTSILVGSAQF